jgi:histidinol-phosphate phosphatase family protein
MSHAGERAVFLDKDGTLIVNVPYNVDCAKVQLAPGAGAAARMLRGAGYRLIVVTNQPGIALGYFDEGAVEQVRDRVMELLRDEGVELDGFYYCPHHSHAKVGRYRRVCECRKPQPGLLRRAASEHAIDLHRSWLVGDILDDVEAGHRAGCRAVLVNNGGETQWQWGPLRYPDLVVPDMLSAADHLCGHPEALADSTASCAGANGRETGNSCIG